MQHTFTIENAFRFGWMRTKQYWATFLLIGLATMAITLIFSLMSGLISTSLGVNMGNTGDVNLSASDGLGIGVYFALQIVSMFISIWLGYNTIKVMIKMIDGVKPKVSELFKFDSAAIAKYFLAIIAYVLVTIAGFILLIIPGIYFAIRYMFVPYLVADKGLGIEQAFKKSSEMTKGKKWYLIGAHLVMLGVIIVGLIALIVGVIPAYILVTFAGLYIYRKLADGHVNDESDMTTKTQETTAEAKPAHML